MRGQYTAKILRKALRRTCYWIAGLSPHEVYWHERASMLGREADAIGADTAADIALFRESLEEVTRAMAWLPGQERLAVDYGCGTGRFTGLFADAVGGQAIGLDPMAPMVALARPTERTRFMHFKPGAVPVEPGTADLVGCINVLGGLAGDRLAVAVSDITNTLRRGGLLFLVESDETNHSAHWEGRQAHCYVDLFAEIPLTLGRRAVQSGCQTNVFWGTKR